MASDPSTVVASDPSTVVASEASTVVASDPSTVVPAASSAHPAAGCGPEVTPASARASGTAAAGRPSTGPARPASSTSAPTRSLTAGRSAGSLASAAATSGSRSAGSPARSGVPCTTRYSTASGRPVPYGGRPVPASASVAPQACTSAAGPLPAPVTCSGARYPAVPTTRPVRVTAGSSASSARPRSMTCGRPSTSRTLPGVRSRWMTPPACSAASARATPSATGTSSAAGSGPVSATSSSRRRPGTNRVTSHGVAASGSASSTSTRCGSRTRCSACSSDRNRRRHSRSGGPSRSTLTATARSDGVSPRYTVPMPPWPSRPSRRCGPTCAGSPGRSGVSGTGPPRVRRSASGRFRPGTAEAARPGGFGAAALPGSLPDPPAGRRRRRPARAGRPTRGPAPPAQCARWSWMVSRGPNRGLAKPLSSSSRTTR